jgi:hypothetical protein
MALSILESIRKLIRQGTVTVGEPVGNLHGAAPATSVDSEETGTQTWLVMTAPGSTLPDLRTMLDAAAEAEGRMRLEVAEAGQVVVSLRPGTVGLMRTVITVDRNLSFNVDVRTPAGSAAAVYSNGVLLRTVRGSGLVPVSFAAGQYVLYVLVQGQGVTIGIPRRLTLVGETDIPKTPQWISLQTGYLDEQNGTVANRLRWAADPEAGHYRVLRRQPVLLGDLDGNGVVVEVGSVRDNAAFMVVLQGLHDLDPGVSLLHGGRTVGVVIRSELSEADETTAVLCRLPMSPESWQIPVGAQLYVGTFVEVGRVARGTSAAVVEYLDTSVTAGVAYEYALRSAGLIDETLLSPLSVVQYIVAGDVTPPESIELVDGYPQVLNRVVSARYYTPSDADFAGVHVYFRESVVDSEGELFQVSTLVADLVTVVLPEDNELPDLTDCYVRFLLSGFDEYVFDVASNTNDSITLDVVPPEDMAAAVTAAGNVEIEILRNVQVKTHLGTPSRVDELSFVAKTHGQYFFCTFDRGGNEQALSAGVMWEYTKDDDVFTGPPVLALRQLLPEEQAYFVVEDEYDYSDAVRYAVIEVWAYDPQQRKSQRFEGIKIFYQRSGIDNEPVALTPVPAQDLDFPAIVGSEEEAILDDPDGVRSRYILIDRVRPVIRIWAVNAADQSSDILTYVADIDETPEVQVITAINPLDNTVKITVIADDDTRGITWRIDDSPWTTEDTRSTKKIVIHEPLPLGVQRLFRVIPYRVFFPQLAEPGEEVVVELVRTPRSSIAFENKDENGDRSAFHTTVLYSMVPAPVVLHTGVCTVGAGGVSLTDLGSPGWQAGRFNSSSTSYYYARLRPTAAQGRPVVLRRITGNTPNLLTTASFGTDYVGIGSIPYDIVDGAVLARKVIDGVPQGAFTPKPRREVFARVDGFEIEFYATKNGSYPEDVRRVVVDSDRLPRLFGFSYREAKIGDLDVLDVGFDHADDDATTWVCYERKGAWPTITGTAPITTVPAELDDMDPLYLRFGGSIDQRSYRRTRPGMAAGDVWYAVAIPKNTFGETGPPYTATYSVPDVDDPPITPAPALTGLTLTPQVGSSIVDVTWQRNSGVPDSAVINIAASRSVSPGILVNAARTANQSYAYNVGEIITTSPSGTLRSASVTATLQGGNSITRQVSYRVEQATGGGVALTNVTTQVISQGVCHNGQCGSAQSQPHVRRINWTLAENGQPVGSGSPYRLNILVSHDLIPNQWWPLVFSVDPADSSYLDTTYCQFHDTTWFQSGDETYWTYRVVVVNLEGIPVGISQDTNQVWAKLIRCSGANDDIPF